MTDIIDHISGLEEGQDLHVLRRLRPDFVDGAQACHDSLLAPDDDHGLSPALRSALMHRMAVLNRDVAMAAHYAPDPQGDPALAALAAGEADLPEPLATIARHSDMVTVTPTIANAGHIRALEAAGLTNPQIVALSELIALANFQTRIAAGLRLMGAA